ncbi:hypothetical protein Pmani_026954 [Petrolisthes manimaculis]|uniref:Uncharacterized protein n=1 Tax=Petrolisthes manimaculis TaxID=1843537 RepID=A0AAE1P550_9EUCA|nr:hypothetical protein Pmani_026954 [Petrolisthes manimaculis]
MMKQLGMILTLIFFSFCDGAKIPLSSLANSTTFRRSQGQWQQKVSPTDVTLTTLKETNHQQHHHHPSRSLINAAATNDILKNNYNRYISGLRTAIDNNPTPKGGHRYRRVPQNVTTTTTISTTTISTTNTQIPEIFREVIHTVPARLDAVTSLPTLPSTSFNNQMVLHDETIPPVSTPQSIVFPGNQLTTPPSQPPSSLPTSLPPHISSLPPTTPFPSSITSSSISQPLTLLPSLLVSSTTPFPSSITSSSISQPLTLLPSPLVSSTTPQPDVTDTKVSIIIPCRGLCHVAHGDVCVPDYACLQRYPRRQTQS